MYSIPSTFELQRRWEYEVLAQFAEDGGNREQALNYQLFSWEFCWQAMFALLAASRTIAPATCLRLYAAADFFVRMQVESDPWDYGDSDNAFVTPFFASEQGATREWWWWMVDRTNGPAIDYWLGETRIEFREKLVESVSSTRRLRARLQSTFGAAARPEEDWLHYSQSGQCIARIGFWTLRWDVSSLGYLSTAAHGHLDALHLSIWFKGVALIVDPGTAAYYADKRLRSWLTSRAAHNSPCAFGPETPRRLGPFLWEGVHEIPEVQRTGSGCVAALLNLTGQQMRRAITHSPASMSWSVDDCCVGKAGEPVGFSVRWQFAPGTWIKVLDRGKFVLNRADVSIVIEVSDDWTDVKLVETTADRDKSEPENALAGTVSPTFRKTVFAPYLLLKAEPRGDKPCVFRTTFLASAGA